MPDAFRRHFARGLLGVPACRGQVRQLEPFLVVAFDVVVKVEEIPHPQGDAQTTSRFHGRRRSPP